MHFRSRFLGEMPPVETVAFLWYKKNKMNDERKEKPIELDENVYKEVVNIFRKEREKAYFRQLKALCRHNKRIKRNARTKYLR